MKKLISAALAALTISAALNGCMGKTESLSPVRALSSSAEKSAEWLTERLGADVPENDILLGIADDADAFGADMSGLRSEGYVIRSIGNDTVILGKTADGLDRGVRYYANYCKGESGLDVTYGEGHKVGKLTIAGHDISEYSIRIEADADELHPLAANQLRKYIGDACGIYPEIDNNASGRTFTLVQDKSGAHGDEAFTVEVSENGNVTITGGQYRGCIYGVYDFLEQCIGYRFLYDYDALIASGAGSRRFVYHDSFADGIIDYLYEAETRDVPAQSYTSAPDIQSRAAYVAPSNTVPAEDHVLKMKMNRDQVRGYAKYNGYGVSQYSVHGLSQVITKFVDYDGGAIHSRQCCFSNEENIAIAIDYYTTQLKQFLAAGYLVGRDIKDLDASQVDSGNFCQCEECRKLVAYDRTNAAPIILMTNSIADAIAEIDPNVYVQMLAYYGTTQPPKKTKMSPNVSVWYCFYNDLNKYICYNHPLNGDECEKKQQISNIAYAEEFRTWSRMTDRLGVWYYPGTWYANPIQSCTVFNMLDDFRLMKECGTYGLIVDPCMQSPSDGILNYFSRRLSWSCDMTDEEFLDMIKEYFLILYGPGYEDIFEYYRVWEQAGGNKCWSVMAWSSPADRLDYAFFADNFEYAKNLFADAARIAESDVQEYRVKRLSTQMYYLGLISTYDSMYTNGTDADKNAYLETWTYFTELLKKYPITFDANHGTQIIADRLMSDSDELLKDFDITKTNPAALTTSAMERFPNWWKNIGA